MPGLRAPISSIKTRYRILSVTGRGSPLAGVRAFEEPDIFLYTLSSSNPTTNLRYRSRRALQGRLNGSLSDANPPVQLFKTTPQEGKKVISGEYSVSPEGEERSLVFIHEVKELVPDLK